MFQAIRHEQRQKSMREQMKMMMLEIMEKVPVMKPKAGVLMHEHEDWINQHQKFTDDMRGPMMQEHHMMMGMNCMSTDSGDAHMH